MIHVDGLYLILIIYGFIAFVIGFVFSKNLYKEKIDDLIFMIHKLKTELKKCHQLD